MHFEIDSKASLSLGCLALRSNFTLSPKNISQMDRAQRIAAQFIYRQELAFQAKEGGSRTAVDRPIDFFRISCSNCLEAMELIAAFRGLFFQGRELICDFFLPTKLFYFVDNTSKAPYPIIPKIETSTQQFDLKSCDFLFGGPPHFYIKGISLRLIEVDIRRSELMCAYTAPESLSLTKLSVACDDLLSSDDQLPKLQFALPNGNIAKDSPLEPLPLLRLKGPSGAFADLWMSYCREKGREGVVLPFSEQSSDLKTSQGQLIGKRNSAAEASWEKDLLETDFIKKVVSDSQYYCPLESVSKSLAFLLELGWQVEDFQGRSLKLLTESQLKLESKGELLLLTGSMRYGNSEVGVHALAKVFTRQERFIELGVGSVGLLPAGEEWDAIKDAASSGEIVAAGIAIKSNRIFSLPPPVFTSNLLESDEATQKLQREISDFKGLCNVPPSEAFIGTLRPYQQEGVNWLAFLYQYGFHGMLADDMGLGKTVQLLAFISQLPSDKPVLIIAPTSLLFNWKREIERFLPPIQLHLHYGPQRSEVIGGFTSAQIVLTSYTTIRRDLVQFEAVSWRVIALDEAQWIKNSHTQTSQAICQLRGDLRIALTGTPLENNLQELWSHFHFLMPELLGDEKDFNAKVAASHTESGVLSKIRQKIKPFMLRRTKENVAADLPQKIEEIVWVRLSSAQRKLYESFLGGFKKNLIEKVKVDGIAKHRIELLEAILRLRQICCHPALVQQLGIESDGEISMPTSAKLELLIEDIATAIAEGRKILVYSQFTSMLSLIATVINSRGWRYSYLDGATVDREAAVQQFQSECDIPLFLLSLKAGGVGLNLTAADCVFIYDPWWNDAIERQAIDRAHRIGRKGVVFAKRYIAVETIEEKILKLKETKNALIGEVTSGEFTTNSLSVSDLEFLLE